MEPNKILQSDFLDILFEGRNKAYGAYQLRKTYKSRMAVALGSMMALCALFFLSSLFASDKGRSSRQIIVEDVFIEDLNKKKDEPEPLPPPPPPREQLPRVEIARFTPPQIVVDAEVNPEDELKEMDRLEDSRIGVMDQDGRKDDHLFAPPVEERSTGIVEAPKNEVKDIDRIFTKVEKEARFPGGPDGWRRYLERNLNANIAVEDGAPIGNYTVKVQFIVDRQGAISNVQAIEKPIQCPGCAAEAEKIIKRGPKWEPAIQNGQKVIFQAVQYITFQVAE